MSRCPSEDHFDDYLLERLGESEKAAFEAHYFECPACFERLKERDEIRHVVKSGGVFRPGEEPAFDRTEKAGMIRRPIPLSLPKPWAWAGAATLALAGILFFLPRIRGPVNEFVLTDTETLRGAAVSLVFPMGDIAGVPAAFEWRALGSEVEYQITLSGESPLWQETTRGARLDLPETIKARLAADTLYTWQVKAFSREGTLVAVSPKAAFTILR